MMLLFLNIGCILAIACAKNMNILLIVADDLGYNDLGSYGSPTVKYIIYNLQYIINLYYSILD